MFTCTDALKEHLKQFLKEEHQPYLEADAEHFFKGYEIIKSYQQNFAKEVIVDVGSANGVFVPAIHAISPFKEIHIFDRGKQDARKNEC